MNMHYDPIPDWPYARKRRRRPRLLTELGWILVLYFSGLALAVWWVSQ